MPNHDGGFPLPEVIDPPRISVCVPVPDDVWHRRAFMGALYVLTYWWSWQRDPDKKAREAARVWLEIWQEVSDQLDAGEECGEGGEDMTNVENMLKDLKSELRLLSYDGTPGSINPESPTVRFDDPTGLTTGEEYDYRTTALCIAVRRWVYEILRMVIQRGSEALALALPGVVALLAAGPIAFIVGAAAAAISAYLLDEVIDAAEDQEALDEVVCDLYKALRGRVNTQAQFEAAITSLADGSGNRAIIVFCLKQFSTKLENYLMLNDGLAAGYTAAQAGAENDCCDDPPTCSGWIDFQNDGVPFGQIFSTVYDPGAGLRPTQINGSNEQCWWQHEWEAPCLFAAGPNRLRVKSYSASTPDTFQFWVKRADTGVWQSAGAWGIPNGDGWDNARPMGVIGDNMIIGIAAQVYKPTADPDGNSILRGFWWGSNTSGTPPF